MISIQKITAEETWPMRHKVMYPEKTLQEMILPEDQNGEHFGLFENDQLVSVVSLFVNDRIAQFRKLATVNEKQGLGYGRKLLDYIIGYSLSSGVNDLWCNARVNKASFYRKAGFLETDQTYSQDGYDFVIMKREL